ncbi:MAG: TlpA disulfide reductase family protein [Synergistes sp.]|nr:TlpA disulfide reductase family protein [Synergistes sp.]
MRRIILFFAAAAAIVSLAASSAFAYPAKGSKTEDFTLTALTGEKVSLYQMRGKIVVLNFWATWCPPCRSELPEFDAMNTKFRKSSDKVLFMINVTDGRRDTKEKVARFVHDEGYKFKVLLDNDGKVSDKFGISGIPMTFVVDREGKIVGYILGATTERDVMELVRKAK